MKVKLKVEKEYDAKLLLVKASVRYWEDAKVNGVEDVQGDLIPCRKGDLWCPEIEIETGKILNWTKGTTASIHYKVCDQFSYWLADADGATIAAQKNYYVPSIMCPKDTGYGDYIIMDVDANGIIDRWVFDAEKLLGEDD